MRDEQGQVVVTARQNDQAPRPAWPGMALIDFLWGADQPRLCGARLSGFDGFADGA
jgi:hypothetical protein